MSRTTAEMFASVLPDIFEIRTRGDGPSGSLPLTEEMLLDPEQKIARPRQIYVGAPRRDFVPRDDRS